MYYGEQFGHLYGEYNKVTMLRHREVQQTALSDTLPLKRQTITETLQCVTHEL